MGKSLKGKELGVGITQRKDKTYQARFTNRFGKRETVYAASLTEIRKKLQRAQIEDEKQSNVIDTGITLDQWFERWLDVCKSNCLDTTKRTYQTQYNRLRRDLGWQKLVKLNRISVQNAFNQLATDKMRADCKRLLSNMLKCAEQADLVPKNCAKGIVTDLDHEESEEKRILSDEEIELLLYECYDSLLYPIIVIGLQTGMRIGEILGLTWQCVDLTKGIIYVERTLCYLPGVGYEFHQPKTRAGKRQIPMTKAAKEILVRQKMWKSRVVVRHAPKPGFEDLVFCSKTNYPLNDSNIRTGILYLVNKINQKYPEIEFEKFTPHALRHTFATKAYARGVKPKFLQKILGHASLKTTMDLYCHVEDGSLREEMELFGEVV